MEVIYCKIVEGKLYNRGFLHGPYCPIYGFGAILIISFLIPFSESIPLVFFLGLLITSILEYITGFLMEKIFKAKWWDYSDLKFNIKGRVCLQNSILFGILSLFLIYILNPFISKVISQINSTYLLYISHILICIFLIDISITVTEILNLKKKLIELKEVTETFIKEKNLFNENSELSKKINEFKQKIAEKKYIKNSHIINAFPNLKFKENNNEFLNIKKMLKKSKK